MPNTTPLMITGMPRAGATVAAQILFRAGLFLGDRLLAPSAWNPEGPFEDAEIVDLQEAMLAACGGDALDADSFKNIAVYEASQNKATQLLQRKFSGPAAWGWKDPRTVLFLDFWDALLPQAKWIFVVRDPAQVAWSFLRLQELDDRIPENPLAAALKVLRLWQAYHRRILTFVQKNPERCLLLLAPDDYEEAGQALLQHVIRDTWHMPLPALEGALLYKRSGMHTQMPAWLRVVAKAHTQADAIFQALQKIRAAGWQKYLQKRVPGVLPWPVAAVAKPVICVLSPERFAYSATFIRAQAEYLPAQVKRMSGRIAKHLANPQDRIRENGPRFLDKFSFGAYLRQEKIQAVLAQYGPMAVEAVYVCLEEKVPLIVHFHGYDAFRADILKKYNKEKKYQRVFTAAKALIAVSRPMVEQLVRLGAPPGKVFCNPCGVDTHFFNGASPGTSGPLFVAVGRFVDKKAPHLTILAFHQMAAAHPEARLAMIGDGPLLEACKQLALALGLAGCVEFPGARSPLEVAQTMKKARAFVQHSLTPGDGDSEGTPVGMMEAGASGLPVVSTRHAGIPDLVIHGTTGLLVEERDIDGMAKAMAVLAADSEMAARLGAAARRHICENFSLEKSIQRLWEIIEKTF